MHRMVAALALLFTAGAHTINPSIYRKLPYDTVRDFTHAAPEASQWWRALGHGRFGRSHPQRSFWR